MGYKLIPEDTRTARGDDHARPFFGRFTTTPHPMRAFIQGGATRRSGGQARATACTAPTKAVGPPLSGPRFPGAGGEGGVGRRNASRRSVPPPAAAAVSAWRAAVALALGFARALVSLIGLVHLLGSFVVHLVE